MGVSIQTIADATGFSRSTVGHVLAGRGDELKVAPRTQQIVLETARRMGYRPSFFAASLRRGQSDLIVVLGSSSRSQWRAERLRQTTQALYEHEHRVQLFDWRWARRQPQPFFELLADLRPRGMVVSEVVDQGPMLAQLREAGTVIVIGDGPRTGVPELPADGVYLDRQDVGRLAMSHLLKLGHRRIACAQRPNARAWELRDRCVGYRRALKDHGVPASALRYVWNDDEREGGDELAAGYRTMLGILALDPRPTGVVASNDVVATGLLKACADRGVRVPEEMSIIGAEDHAVSAYLPQPLTSLRFPIEQMAQHAASLLQRRLEAGEADADPPRYVPISAELVPRATTAAPAEAAHDRADFGDSDSI